MKNFLKLTATFACLVALFSACNTDDTVDGYIPVFTAIETETVSVTRGDSRIQVVWDVPNDENITAAKISWSSSVESGSEIVDILDYQHSSGTYGEDDYESYAYTYIIGEDDYRYDSKGDFIPLPSGVYTVTIQSMEGKYVGTGGCSVDDVTVYNKAYYQKEENYPGYESVVHNSTAEATITWTSFPADCYDVLITFTTNEVDDDDEAILDYVVVYPGDFTFTEGGEAQTTPLEGAKINSTITLTPSFRPEDALEDDIVTIADSDPIEIVIEAGVKAEPTIVAEMGGLRQLYVEWLVFNDEEFEITSTTLAVYDGDDQVGDNIVINKEGGEELYKFVSDYSADAEFNTAYRTITETNLDYTFEAGKLYTIKLVNNMADDSYTDAIQSNGLFVYDESTTYITKPTIYTITHNGESAYIVWDMSVLQDQAVEQNGNYYKGDEDDPDYLDYYALDKIIVTYDTNEDDDQTAEFTSDLTTLFTLECELPDAKIGTTYSYEAYFRPASAIPNDDNYATIKVEEDAEVTIPAPVLAAVNGVTIYSGYNSDDSSYLQVGWSDVAGALGSVNDNIEELYVFYTLDKGRIDAMADEKEDDCDYGNDYAVAAAAFADYESSTENIAPTPIMISDCLPSTIKDAEGYDFVEDIVESGYTITIGKTEDDTDVTISADKTYYIAIVTKGYKDNVNENGQFAFTNIDAYNPADITPGYDEDNYIDRNVTTYNTETYTGTAGALKNQQIFSVNAPTITRNLTNATLAWQWDAYAKETVTDAADVVAVGVKSYNMNVSSGDNPYEGDEIKVYTGESTTLANVKAGTGAIPATTGYTAYFCPASGLDEVAIEQTLALDIPYLAVPTPTLALSVGVNAGGSYEYEKIAATVDTDAVMDTASTEGDGEPYIQATWEVADTNSDNIGSFNIYYQADKASGAYSGEYTVIADEIIASGDRSYDIAPEYSYGGNTTDANLTEDNILIADLGYQVYISCVDLDGYERPSKYIDGDEVDTANAIDGAKATATYDLQTYSEKYMKLADYVEELAFDGETMVVTWGTFDATQTDVNIKNNNYGLEDCVGVLVKMTSGDRINQTFGYNYMLEATTKVPDVAEADKFEYTTYFRPDDGLTIVAGATTTKATYIESGNEASLDLAVPVSTAPTKAVITSIVSTYDDDNNPAITLTWTFDEDDEAGMANILSESGAKNLYVHWYRDDVSTVTAANASGTNGGTTTIEITEENRTVEEVTPEDGDSYNVYTYTYEIPSDRLTVGSSTASYTIYVGTKNTNEIEYTSAVFDEVKTYNSNSYTVSNIPAAATVASGINNDIEVTWDVEGVIDDLRTIYLGYNGGYGDEYVAQGGTASVPYVTGVNAVTMNGKFGPNYDQFMSEFDADYDEKFGVVTYPKEIDIQGTTTYYASITAYDITYSFEDDTYRILTARGLGAFADIVNGTTTYSGDTDLPISSNEITDWTQYRSANGVLAADIDLSSICSSTLETNWTPIGGTTTATSYMGTFDGAGFTISGLYIYDTSATGYQGLFGYVNSATIKNVKLSAPSITLVSAGASRYIGGIAAYITNTTISDCHVVGGAISNTETNNAATTSASTAETGGIVGYMIAKSKLLDCSTSASITAVHVNYVGGIVGQMSTGYIINCHNTGDITGPLEYGAGTMGTPTASACQYVGGIVGQIPNVTPNIIVGCSNTGDVQAHKCVGGITGSSAVATDGSYIVSCYNTGSVMSTDQYVGGLIGLMPASDSALVLAGCYSTGSIYSTYSSESYTTMYGLWAGGLIGGFSNVTTVSDTYLTGIEDNYFVYTAYPYLELTNPVIWAVGNKNAYLNETTDTYMIKGHNTAYQADIVEDYAIFNGRVGDMNDAVDAAYSASSFTSNITGITTNYNYYYTISDLLSAPQLTSSNPNIKSPETLTNIEIKTTEQDKVTVSWTYGNGSDGINSVVIYTRPVDSDGDWDENIVSVSEYDTELTLEEKVSASYDIYIRTRGAYGAETVSEYTADSPYTVTVSMDPEGLDLKWFGEGEPFMIYSEDGLTAFADIVNGEFKYDPDLLTITGDDIVTGLENSSANAILMADIEMTSNWSKVIGTATATELGSFSDANPYSGTFDGNGMTISNFELLTSNPCQGLFGYISGATIKDVTLTDVSVSASNLYNSVLVGVAMAYSTIEDCTVSGSVTFGYNASGAIAGGVIGGSKVSNCVNNATITASGSYTGAIVGDLRNSTVENSVNNGTLAISGSSYVGGIVGALTSNSTTIVTSVVGCENNGAISGSATSYVGGIAGYVENNQANAYSAQAYIQNSDNNGDIEISGATGYVSGILGGASNIFQILASSNYGDVTAEGANYVAGIVGEASGYTTVQGDTSSRSYNRGNITGNQYVGGIVGYNQVAVSYYNNTGLVKGTLDFGTTAYGQLVGANGTGGSLSNCDDEYTDGDIDIRYLALGVYEISSVKGLEAFAAIVNGTGQPDNVTSYGITGVTGLNWAKNAAADGIIANDFTFVPDTDTDIPAMSDYTGIFDGQGHTITGLEVSGNALFATILEGAVVQNLTLVNPYITRSGYYSAAFVGMATSATVYNCHVKVDAATALNTVTINEVSYVKIISSADRYTGSIVGSAVGGENSDTSTVVSEMSVIACSNEGSLPTGGYSNGGIIGNIYSYNSVPVTVKYCLNTAVLSMGQYSGGIVGNLESGYTATCINIVSCTNTANVTGTSTQIGGVTGTAGGNVIYCANYGDINSGNGTIGGITGQTHNYGTVNGTKPSDYSESAYRIYGTPLFDFSIEVGEYTITTLGGNCNYGNITTTTTSASNAGGVAGTVAASGSLTNYNNVGNVTSGYTNVGGIAGNMGNGATLTGTADAHCYNKGTITGTANVGGIVGTHSGTATNLSYYDNYGTYSSTTGDATVGSIVGSASNYDETTCVDYVNIAGTLTGLSIQSSYVSNGQSTITVSWSYPTDMTNMADVVVYYKRDISDIYTEIVFDDLETKTYTLGADENITNGLTYHIYVASRNASGAQTGAMTSQSAVYTADSPYSVTIE